MAVLLVSIDGVPSLYPGACRLTEPSGGPGRTKPCPVAGGHTTRGPDGRWIVPGPPVLERWDDRRTPIVGRVSRARKGACPLLRPPSFPHERLFGERLCGSVRACLSRYAGEGRGPGAPGGSIDGCCR